MPTVPTSLTCIYFFCWPWLNTSEEVSFFNQSELCFIIYFELSNSSEECGTKVGKGTDWINAQHGHGELMSKKYLQTSVVFLILVRRHFFFGNSASFIRINIFFHFPMHSSMFSSKIFLPRIKLQKNEIYFSLLFFSVDYFSFY